MRPKQSQCTSCAYVTRKNGEFRCTKPLRAWVRHEECRNEPEKRQPRDDRA
jgi:hypothetical protein